MRKRIAGEVIVNRATGQVLFDGVEFPCHITPDVDVDSERHMCYLTITVLAERITVVAADGTTRTVETDQAPDLHADDLAWARVEGRRIVREAMADRG